MKKLLILIIFAVFLCACGRKETDYAVTLEPEKIPPEETESVSDSADDSDASDDSFAFSDFQNLQFTFSSGAGGWATLMTIDENGHFTGEYFDGELGVTGPDYPNGTTYQSNFHGSFTAPEKINDYTFSMKISEISYEQEPGTEEIIDGMLFCYGKPYGIDGAEELLIYLPGAPLDQLPEMFLSWVRTDWNGNNDITEPGRTGLPFYGIYNEVQECGFSSYDILDGLKSYIQSVEEWSDSIKNSLQNDPLTQLELNEESYKLYTLWDNALNYTWDIVKQQTTDENSWNAILNEQRAWITAKEQETAAAGAEYEGGSIKGFVMNMKAAELTENRVYELISLLE